MSQSRAISSIRGRPALVYLDRVIVLAVIYHLAARLGLKMAYVQDNTSPVWPPTGIGLAALLIFGARLWPGISLGVLHGSLLTGAPFNLALDRGINDLNTAACYVNNFEWLNLGGKQTMTTLFTIELTINMPDDGRLARKLLNLYHSDLPVDIKETAFNLCDANEAIQARKFAKLTLKRSEVWSSQEGSLKIFALLSVSGEDFTFIKQVITKYMEGFPDYLKRARDRYFSRTSFPPDISLQPTDWNAEVQ